MRAALQEAVGLLDALARRIVAREFRCTLRGRVRTAARHCPALLAAVAAEARRTGLPEESLLALNLATDLPGVPDGCTNILAVGSATLDGGGFLHKNRDHLRAFLGDWRIEAPAGAHRFLASSAVGDHTVALGLNAAGIAVATNSVLSPESHRYGLGHRVLARKVLEEASALEEIVPLLESLPRAGGFNLLCLDGAARGLVVEATARRLWSEVVEDGVRVRTNHFQVLQGAYDEEGGRHLFVQSSRPRLAQARAGLEGREGKVDLALLRRLARTHSAEEAALVYGGSICNHGAVWSTLTSGTVAVPRQGGAPLAFLWAGVGSPCATPYFPLSPHLTHLPAAFGDGTLFALAERVEAGLPPPAREDALARIQARLDKAGEEALLAARAIAAPGRSEEAHGTLATSLQPALEEGVLSLALLAAHGEAAAGDGLTARLPEAIRVAPGQEVVLRFQILNGLAETVTVTAEAEGLPMAAQQPFPTHVRVRPGRVGSGLLTLTAGPPRREVTVVLRRADGERSVLHRQAVRILPYQAEKSD
ncbi:MAG TPA: C45 family peptidase [Candidatus Methylomirabilis sp.]|nr:C45 family peptidase [Candidatus Methylomirabilis sp.]